MLHVHARRFDGRNLSRALIQFRAKGKSQSADNISADRELFWFKSGPGLKETNMSVSGIASSLFAAFNPTQQQNKSQQIQQDFQQLGQDLQAGNLTQAQTVFSSLTQLLPAQFQTNSATSTTQSGSQTSNPISQALSQLGSDLQSGNLSAAQSDFSTLQNDLQRAQSTGGFHHHHTHGGPILENQNGQNGANSPASLFGQLGQDLQSGNLTAAQQTYSTLQQDFLQFQGGGSATGGGSSTGTNGSLNVSA
jgi:outer membrane protein assembly factor BamD (BamD/ComL family)